jgi:uncharacterized protein
MTLFRNCFRCMLWLCVLGLASGGAQASPYEPLDCSKGLTTAGKTICDNYTLGQDEARQATLFAVVTSLVAMGQRANLIESQRRWIETRETCGRDAKCLSIAYKARIEDLSKILDALAKRGPF